jgi:hypothetical protein
MLPGKNRYERAFEAFATGNGPAATSFFLRESTARFNPSRLLAPRSNKSPFSAKTTSSTVNELFTLTMAKPTLRVICWPFAMTNDRSFFSLCIPSFSKVVPDTQVYSLPVSTNRRGIFAPWFR